MRTLDRLTTPGADAVMMVVCVVWVCGHRCKNVLYVFFILVTFFTFFNVFFNFRNVFYLKNVGKVQSGKQINKKHFQNNSNETDL